MADWNNPNPINTNPGGDTVYQGFVKTQNNFDDVYTKLNTVKKLQTGTTAPSNPAVGELWFDETSGILKRYNGTSWVDVVVLPDLSNIETIKSNIIIDNGYVFDIGSYDGNIQYVREYYSEAAQQLRLYPYDKTNSSPLSIPFSLQLYYNGTYKKVWHDGEGEALLSSNGYQKLPSRLIIQWFKYTSSIAGRENIPFPIAFPTACLAVVGITDHQANPMVQPIVDMLSTTNATVNIAMCHTSINAYLAGYSAVLLAIGY